MRALTESGRSALLRRALPLLVVLGAAHSALSPSAAVAPAAECAAAGADIGRSHGCTEERSGPTTKAPSPGAAGPDKPPQKLKTAAIPIADIGAARDDRPAQAAAVAALARPVYLVTQRLRI